MARILIVDDSPTEMFKLTGMLEKHGHQVLQAANGADGVALARKEKPDLVLMDIVMPGLNGYEVARRMRQMPTLQGVLLIALTGYGQAQDHAAAKQAGFDHHFVKPADPGSLAACIAAHEPDTPRTKVGATT